MSLLFRGTTPKELKKDFETSVDGYLDWCQELDQEPEKPSLSSLFPVGKRKLHSELHTH